MAAYRSSRRDRQAAATRREILMAARDLFATRGYAQTSMSDIAEHADVAVQTIYGTWGSKKALALGLVDLIDEEADIPAAATHLADVSDPGRAISLTVQITRRLNERCHDIITALTSAAAVEPDAAAAVAVGSRRHIDGARRFATQLAEAGALRDGLTLERAASITAALTSVSMYRQLTEDHHWSYDDCASWLEQTLRELLLDR